MTHIKTLHTLYAVTNIANSFTSELVLYLKNREYVQLLLNVTVNFNSPLNGTLSHAQTSLKSAHFYLWQQNLEAHTTNLLVLPLFIKTRQKLVNSTIHTCNSMQQSRHHTRSSTPLVKLLEYGLFHVQKIPLQIPDKASVLNLIHSSKFQAIKFAAGK